MVDVGDNQWTLDRLGLFLRSRLPLGHPPIYGRLHLMRVTSQQEDFLKLNIFPTLYSGLISGIPT